MPKLKASLEDCCIITKRYKIYDIIYSSHHSFRSSPMYGVFKNTFNQQLFIVNLRESSISPSTFCKNAKQIMLGKA